MGANADRSERPRDRTVLRRARAVVLSRVAYWKHSYLARRLQAADVINQGLVVAAVLLLCLVPFLLVLQSVSGRKEASAFITRFGLTGEAAHAVRQPLTSPTARSTAISGLTWVFFILFGIAAAGAIQELYERVFEVKGRGVRDSPRSVAGLAAALGVSFVGPGRNRGSTGSAGSAWSRSQHYFRPRRSAGSRLWLLLGGRLRWRELFPSALATGICWLGMVIFFRLTLSSTIFSDYRK